NVFFDNKGYNIHGYGKNAGHWNVSIENNITFQAGRLARDSPEGGELLLGLAAGGTAAPGQNVTLTNNYGYAVDDKGTALSIGYEVGNDAVRIIGNYFVGGAMRFNSTLGTHAVMAGNFLQGRLYKDGLPHEPKPAEWPDNTLKDDGGRPSSGQKVVAFTNKYEMGRCNVAIYNWDHSPSVRADLSMCLRVGDEFTVYWAPRFATKTAAVAVQ